MMNPIPHEFALGGVYTTPWLVAALLGFAATLISIRLLIITDGLVKIQST